MSSRHSMIDIEVIATHSSSNQIGHLTIRILQRRRYAPIPNQLIHVNPNVALHR